MSLKKTDLYLGNMNKYFLNNWMISINPNRTVGKTRKQLIHNKFNEVNDRIQERKPVVYRHFPGDQIERNTNYQDFSSGLGSIAQDFNGVIVKSNINFLKYSSSRL
jgi:hypothetical protein